MRNNIVILDTIRSGKNCFSKKDVHSKTGIAWGTMCTVVDSLLASGRVFARKEKPCGRGRPGIPLCINCDAAFFLGIDIGSSQTHAVVCDLAFNTLYRYSITTEHYKNPQRFFVWLFDCVDSILAASQISTDKLSGIGLAISGNIDSPNGVIVSGGNFGIKWGENLPVTARLLEHTGVPAYAVTTQVAAVWGEYHFGRCAGCANLVTVGLGVGIGSGVVSNHHLLVSQPGRPVGYIGHMLLPDNKRVCTCGFNGCLEAYSGGNSLAKVGAEKFPGKAHLHSARALDEAAAQGDKDAAKIMMQAASYNAVGVASMIQLYSPDALIFSGGQSRKDGFLYTQTLAALNEILPQERRASISIELTTLGSSQSALGAARLAYENFF